MLAVLALAGVVIVVALVVSRLLAPTDSEIVARATASASGWRQAGSITHFTTVVEQANPQSGASEKLRREHWVSFDGLTQRVSTSRVGTPRTYASIFEPDPLRTGNIAEETSDTASISASLTAASVETPQGLWVVADAAATARHRLWWGPCGSCHAPKQSAEALARAQVGLPPYLAPVNRAALKVVGKGKVAGRRTYVLRAERPSVPNGYRELTLIDVDRKTFLPLRYRIEVVQDLGKSGSDVVERTQVDVTSHELLGRTQVQSGWASLALPADAPYVARQSFDASTTALWPPADSIPLRPGQPVTAYDLGESYPLPGGRMTGVRFARRCRLGPAQPAVRADPL